jgi:alpha-1,3/alpha-1,6-mannosyltransferase
MILFDLKYDVVVCDLVSAVVPILRLFGYKTIFYCHHPDKLLAPQGGGIIKRIYRFFIDIW